MSKFHCTNLPEIPKLPEDESPENHSNGNPDSLTGIARLQRPNTLGHRNYPWTGIVSPEGKLVKSEY